MDPVQLELCFQDYMDNLADCVPDGLIPIDLAFLQNSGLLACEEFDLLEGKPDKHFFHVMETPEKLTLINTQFVVWVAPHSWNGVPATFTLIAFNEPEGPRLDLVFTATGVYNASHIVLRVLDHFLDETLENEGLISNIAASQP